MGKKLVNLKENNKALYENGAWYMNNYKSTGSEWLIKSLEKLSLPSNYRFGSFSANLALYEKDAFRANRGMSHFYVSDLFGDEMPKELLAESEEGFTCLKGNRDLASITMEDIDNKKLDVVLDFRGAIWHSIMGKKDSGVLVNVLKVMTNILNENGYVLLDSYKGNSFDNLKFDLVGAKKKMKARKIRCFGEFSTHQILNSVFGKNISLECLGIRDKNSEYPLARKLEVVCLEKANLDKLIAYIEKNTATVEWGYKKTKIMCKLQDYGLIALMIVIPPVAGVIALFFYLWINIIQYIY